MRHTAPSMLAEDAAPPALGALPPPEATRDVPRPLATARSARQSEDGGEVQLTARPAVAKAMRGGVEASLGARSGKHLAERHVGRHLDLLAHAVPHVHREPGHSAPDAADCRRATPEQGERSKYSTSQSAQEHRRERRDGVMVIWSGHPRKVSFAASRT
eukprot:scaffold2639_cov95-Isochrysis_galbana.AAC.4